MTTQHVHTTVTEATCGVACWMAKEPECHCSCGGKNHGILLTPGGTQPPRMAKIDGVRYVLEGIGKWNDLYLTAYQLNRLAGYRRVDKAELIQRQDQSWWNQYKYPWTETDKGAPARIKRAEDNQMKWREVNAIWEAAGKPSGKPYLLWKREVMPAMPAELVVDTQTGVVLDDQLPPDRSKKA